MPTTELRSPDARGTMSAGRVVLSAALVVMAVALTVLGGFDLEGARMTLGRAQSATWLALLPFALLLTVDATAWAIALDVPPSARVLGRLIQARLGIEAVSLTVPGSILVADGLAPMILGRAANLPVSAAVAGVAIKKWGIILGHVAVLWLAAVVGSSYFERVAERGGVSFAPVPTLLISGAVALGMAAWLWVVLSHGAVERLRRLLGRTPFGWMRSLMARAAEGAARADTHAHAFFGGPRTRVWTLVAVSTLVWLAESLEVYVLFRILGANPSPADVLAMEALLTVVRSLAFFSPGGLGAQEFAYLTLIPPLLGVEGAALASGFVVLRRLRDVVTIGLGYLSLATRVARA